MTTVRRIALLTAALAASLLLTGCSDSGDQLKTTAAATVSEAVSAVEVADARRGSIRITAGDGPGVTVHRTVHYRDAAEPKPRQGVTGGVLTFTNGCDNCYVDYELQVPAAAKVTVGNTSGAIEVTGVRAAEIRASSGEVKAEAIAGPLAVETSSGSVTGTALAGPSAVVRTDSGTTRLDFANASSVEADTGSGSVTLKVPGGPYKADVTTSSGRREVKVPTDPAAASTLTVRATSGDVTISTP
ncbi:MULTISPECIES: DUF4097 family beta strand repeat-containing protein [Streptomyces]|uniref:DUF4097 family beta strand repeat-containing protein n=1 Tax=Streptomyces TaxID=1883 RepID=UPI001E59B9B3|nr:MULTISPECIES: DUF4097 family beta strand repeat-containing protein [Streptomyces]